MSNPIPYATMVDYAEGMKRLNNLNGNRVDFHRMLMNTLQNQRVSPQGLVRVWKAISVKSISASYHLDRDFATYMAALFIEIPSFVEVVIEEFNNWGEL